MQWSPGDYRLNCCGRSRLGCVFVPARVFWFWMWGAPRSDPLRASAGDHENSSATGFGRWPPLDTFWRDENYPPSSDWQVPAYGGSLAPTRRRVDKLRFPKSPRRRHIKRAVFESTASPPQGSRVQFQPFIEAVILRLGGRRVTCVFKTSSETRVRSAAKRCGSVKTTSVRPRSGGLTRAA